MSSRFDRLFAQPSRVDVLFGQQPEERDYTPKFGAAEAVENAPRVDPNASKSEQFNQRMAVEAQQRIHRATQRDIDRNAAAYEARKAEEERQQTEAAGKQAQQLAGGGAAFAQMAQDQEAADRANPEYANPDTWGERISKSVARNWAGFEQSAAGFVRQAVENAPDLAGALNPALLAPANAARPVIEQAGKPLVQASEAVQKAAQADIEANAYKLSGRGDYYVQNMADSLVQMIPTVAMAYLTKGENVVAEAGAEGAARSANPIVRFIAKYSPKAAEFAGKYGESLAGNAPSLSVLGAQQGAAQYGQSRAAGRTVAQSNADSLVFALAESIPETMELDLLMKPGGHFLPRLLKSSGMEGGSEMLTQAVEDGYSRGFLKQDMTWGQAVQNMVDAGIIGFGMGAAMGAGSHAIHTARGGEPGSILRSIRDAEFTTTPDAEATRAFDPNLGIRPVPNTTKGVIEAATEQSQETPEDRASPLAAVVDLGAAKTLLAGAHGKMGADSILDRNNAPQTGSMVELMGKRWTVEDAFTDENGEDGVTLSRDGQRQKVYFNDLADAGHALTPIADPRGALDEAVAQAAPGTALPETSPSIKIPTHREDSGREQFMARVRRAENDSGDVNAQNPMSSASGPYQFTDSTFDAYYRKLYGTAPPAGVKNDPEVQQHLMDVMTRDNEARLKKAGYDATAGNLYLAHFAGPQGAINLLRNPNGSAETILGKKVANANPSIIKGKTAAEVIAWADQKMGGSGSPTELGTARFPDGTPAEPESDSEFDFLKSSPETQAAQQAMPEAQDQPLIQPEATVDDGKGDGSKAAPRKVETAADLLLVAPRVNTEPTPGQAEAGNYQHSHLKLHGMDIAVENPVGSTRRGTDANGQPWETTMEAAHYGRIKGTLAADDEHVDVYIGPHPSSNRVFVVDQYDPKTGKFDETKSVLGVNTREEAQAIYDAGFSDGSGPSRRGAITEMPVENFKRFVEENGHRPASGIDDLKGFSSRSEDEAKGASRTESDAALQAVDQRQGSDQQSEKSVLSQLRRAWDQAASRVGGELPGVLGRGGAETVEGAHAGEAGQQRALRAGEHPVGDTQGAGAESAQESNVDAQRPDAMLGGLGGGIGARAVDSSVPTQSGRNDGRGGVDHSTARGSATDLTRKESPAIPTRFESPSTQSESNVPALSSAPAEIRIGNRSFPFTTMEQASAAYRATIDKMGIGNSETPQATIHDAEGNQVAHISYNGRIWPGTSKDWSAETKPLYDPTGRDSPAIPAPDETKALSTQSESTQPVTEAEQFDPEPHVKKLRDYIAKGSGSLNDIGRIANHLGVTPEQAHRVMGVVASRPNPGFRMTPGRPAVYRKVDAGGGRTRRVMVTKPVPPRYIRDAKSEKPLSTMAFVRKLGGIHDPRHDLRNVGALRNHPGVLSSKGLSVDEIGRTLWEDGRFPNKDPSDPAQRPTEAETIDFLTKESQPSRTASQPSEEEARAAAAEQLQAAIKDSGGLLPSLLATQDRQAIIDEMLASGDDAASAAIAYFERKFAETVSAAKEQTSDAAYDIPFEVGASDEEVRDRPAHGAEAAPDRHRPEGERQGEGGREAAGADRGENGGPEKGQLDAFGTREGDQRRALEQQMDGRKAVTKPQKAAGSDGGLFDNQDRTGDLFSKPADTPVKESSEPIAQARAALQQAMTALDQAEGKQPEKKIEDAGEKIGGARKDRWAERGMMVSDLEDMTEGEAFQLVTKDAVWPKPDYARMVDDGVDPVAAAAVKLLRDSLAAKPRVDSAQGRRDYIEMMRAARSILESVRTVEDLQGVQQRLYDAAGDRGSYYGGQTPEQKANSQKLFSIFKGRRAAFSIGYSELQKVRKMVADGFPAKAEPWKRRYDVRSYERRNPDKPWHVVEKNSHKLATEESFATKAEAEAAAKAVYEGQDRSRRKQPERPHLDEIQRTGADVRGGRDIGSDDFIKDFGFRGVEYGNWVASDERQRISNAAYEALHDLASVIGVPPKALSLGGQLGMAFGARGGGKFAAHYEPGKLVINLTKLSGSGSLAHEWGHALDHYFGTLDTDAGTRGAPKGASGWYTRTDSRLAALGNLRPEMARAFDKLMKTIFKSEVTRAEAIRDAELRIEKLESGIARQREEMAKSEANNPETGAPKKFINQSNEWIRFQEQAIAANKKRIEDLRDETKPVILPESATSFAVDAGALSGKAGMSGYWARPTEMLARSFESYVFDKIAEKGQQSDYLVHGVEPDRYADAEKYAGNPYPTGAEREAINAAYDDLFKTMQVREEDGNPKLYSLSGSGEEVFYSALERAVENSPTKRAPAAQWAATLGKTPGVKREELEWSGVFDWLDMQKGPVDKEALLGVIRDGGIKVDEVVLGRGVNLDPAEVDRETRANLEAGFRIQFPEGGTDEQRERYIEENWEEGRAEMETMLGAEQSDSQFRDWSSDPENPTYRELLITLPRGQGANPGRAPATHWDTDAVVAHVRFMEKRTADGKRDLHLEELQSDWHQKGRDQGYEQPVDPEKVAEAQRALDKAEADLIAAKAQLPDLLREYFANTFPGNAEMLARRAGFPSAERYLEYLGGLEGGEQSAQNEAAAAFSEMKEYGSPGITQEMNDAIDKVKTAELRVNERSQAVRDAQGIDFVGIPNAPFKSTWPALLMKRMIRYAVDNGFDSISWTTGAEQGERYNLAEAVGSIEAARMADGTYDVKPYKQGALDKIVEQFGTGPYTPERVREIYGNDLGGRIMAAADAAPQNTSHFQPKPGDGETVTIDSDLTIGGEGMKAFYDRNLVNITNDIVKKYGAKVEQKPVMVRDDEGHRKSIRDWISRRQAQIEREEKFIEDWNETNRKVGEVLPAAAEAISEAESRIAHFRAQIESFNEQLDAATNGQPHPGFDITPELREAARGGFPLFQNGEINITPQNIEKVQAHLKATLERLGIADRILGRVVDRMADNPQAHGSYWRRVITVAMSSPNATHTINHEAVHALRALNVILPAEWTALVKAARADTALWSSIQRRYAGQKLNTLQMEEEAVADLFGNWSTKREAKGLVGKAFQRITDLLKAIVAAFDRMATGNIQPGQIFRNIESGKVGRRDTGAASRAAPPAMPTEPAYSIPEAPPEEENRPLYSVGEEPRRQKGLSRYAFRDPDTEVAFLTEHEFGPPKPKGMRADQYDLFSRKVLLDELAQGDMENLPYGFHELSFLAAKARIDKAVNDNHAVSEAVRRYYQARTMAEAAQAVSPETIRRNREEDEEGFKAANIRLDKIQGTSEIRDALKSAAESSGDFVDARRGVVSHEETMKLAAELGMTTDELMARRKGQAFNAHELFAAKALLVASANNLVELAAKADGGSDEDLVRFRQAWIRHVAIQEQVSGLTAEAGRTLNSLKLMARSGKDLNARMMKELIDIDGGRGDLEAAARAILGHAGDPASLNRFSRNALKPTWRDKLFELWINGLLSGPATHVVNAVSNTMTAVGQLPEHALASAIGKARSLIRPDTDRILRSEVGARVSAMIHGTGEAARLAVTAMRTGEGSDVMSKLEARTQRAISGRKGDIVRIPSRLLIASDEFYKGVARRMELAAQAAKTATKEGLTGEEYKARVAELVANPTDEMIEKAMDFARYSTFQRPLGEKGRAVSNLINKIPGMRLIVPFMRTPANIFKFAIERTPAAPVLKEVRDDLKAGGSRADLAIARITMGTGIMFTAMAMAAAGLLTGGDPEDDDAKRLLHAKGWQPYSVKIGDTYYSYQRLDPIATVLGLAADLMGNHENMSEDEREKAFGNIFLAIMNQLRNKTFLSGIGDVLEAIHEPKRRGSQWLGRLAGSVIPTGVSQLANAMDPTVRDVRSIKDRLESRIPGLSDNLPAKRDVWGRVITREGGVGPDVASPFWTMTDKHDQTAAALLRAGVNLDVPSRRVAGTDLTPAQYDAYQELAGRFLRNGAERLVASERWQRVTDERRGELFDTLKNRARKAARERLGLTKRRLKMAA